MQAEAPGNANAVRLELGRLEPAAAYLLRVTVVQNDGAEVVTNTYHFRSLAGAGWGRDTLQLVRP